LVHTFGVAARGIGPLNSGPLAKIGVDVVEANGGGGNVFYLRTGQQLGITLGSRAGS